MRFTPPLLLLLIVTRPLSAQAPFPIGPEIVVSDPELVAASGDQSSPSVASDGLGFFVVWNDGRLGGSIRGARVSASGEVLDSTGITLSQSEVPALAAPSVIWTGTEYVVMWRSQAGALFISRVSPSGIVIAREKRLIAGGNSALIAANGRNLLLVYSVGADTRSQLLTPTGDPVADEVLLPPTERLQGMAVAGGRFLMVWTQQESAKALLLDSSGKPLQPSPITLFGFITSDVAVGSDGSSFVVVYGLGRGLLMDLRSTIISNNGVVIGSGTQQNEGGQMFSPQVGWAADHYDVTWVANQSNTIFRTRIDGDGNISNTATVTRADGLSGIGMATTGTRTLLAVTRREPRATDTDLNGRILDEDREFVVAKSAREQRNPAIASNGQEILAAWMEINKDAQGSRIVAARVNGRGEHLDGPGIVLTDFASPQTEAPAVASDGDSFLVAWLEADGNVQTQRIGVDGSLRESAKINNGVGCRFATPSLAFDGTNYFLTHSLCALGIPAAAAAGIRISRVGIPIEPFVVISTWTGIDPKVVWTGRHHFVAWEDMNPADQFPPPPRIVGALVTPDNIVLHAFFIAAQASSKRNIALATNRDSVFAAWQAPKDPPADIVAKMLTRFGDVVADVPVAASSADESHPAVTWNQTSSSYIVAWQTTTAGSTASDIVLRRFTAAGTPIDAAPQLLSGLPRSELRPALAAFTSVTAAAYSREADEPAYGGVGRIFLRFVGAPRRVRAVQ